MNLVDNRFSNWSVKSFAGQRKWNCVCDCGTARQVFEGSLLDGRSKSCGKCIPKRPLLHGAARVGQKWPEYLVWKDMIGRCYRPTAKNFRDYGARGITVCDRWRFGENGMSGFACYIADLGRRPSPELTVERKKNDGNYEPDNCHYATRLVQARNRRPYTKRIAA